MRRLSDYKAARTLTGGTGMMNFLSAFCAKTQRPRTTDRFLFRGWGCSVGEGRLAKRDTWLTLEGR